MRQLASHLRDKTDDQGKRNYEVNLGVIIFKPWAPLTLRLREDDSKWPEKNKDGRQELEIRLGNDHIFFEVSLLLRELVWTVLRYIRQLRLDP